jgi:phage-related minor tail protein
MKTNPALILAAAATFLTLTGCDKKPAGGAADPQAAPAVIDEKTAIANFKTEVEAFSKWAEEKGKAVSGAGATDPMAGIAMMGEITGKFKGIKTDGLPTDLKSAWTDMSGVMSEIADVFKDIKIPKAEKPEDAQKLMAEFFPKMMEIGPKMDAIGKKAEPIMNKLKEVGTKYGIDMSKVGPEK